MLSFATGSPGPTTRGFKRVDLCVFAYTKYYVDWLPFLRVTIVHLKGGERLIKVSYCGLSIVNSSLLLTLVNFASNSKLPSTGLILVSYISICAVLEFISMSVRWRLISFGFILSASVNLADTCELSARGQLELDTLSINFDNYYRKNTVRSPLTPSVIIFLLH